jgi:SAM-dependent methyltransferase
VEPHTSAPELYAVRPLSMAYEIPVFSLPDDYTLNYDDISRDHLDAYEKTGENPFINEALWLACEDSTAALVRRYTPPSARILDVGVGMGRLLARFPELERYGMDISLGYLRVAQRQGINVCLSRIEDMPYQPGFFDTVLCTDVLEHVFDLTCCCKKILSVIKPGGTLIVRVPFREDLEQYVLPSCPYRFIHVRNFDEFSLQLLFRTVFGCSVKEITYAGYEPGRARLKWQIPVFPKVGGALSRILRALRTCLPLDWLVRELYHAAEINVVVSPATRGGSSERGERSVVSGVGICAE